MPILFVIACILSGCFGMVHNQISYTVSNEYFTEFKFYQFKIAPTVPQRIGAAIVGWHASWWMGIFIGSVLIPCGLIIRGNSPYFFGMIRVFGVVIITTALFSLVGLSIATMNPDTTSDSEITVGGRRIADPVAFVRAGTMHNFSYTGGSVGIFTGLAAIMIQFLRAEKSLPNVSRGIQSIERIEGIKN